MTSTELRTSFCRYSLARRSYLRFSVALVIFSQIIGISHGLEAQWDFTKITGMNRLAEWRKRVFIENNDSAVRVFVERPSWMSGTSAPVTRHLDGSTSLRDCQVPCFVEFKHSRDVASTNARIRKADVIMRVNEPWSSDELQLLRSSYPKKKTVFASWEPMAHSEIWGRVDDERRGFDWLASFSFQGRFAADVPSTYMGLDDNGGTALPHESLFSVDNLHRQLFHQYRAKREGKCNGVRSTVFMAVSNCKTERTRLLSAFLEEMHVDSFGSCLHNSNLSTLIPACRGLSSRHAEKACMMDCYLFVLSIENTHDEIDYATEKLFDTLEHGWSVPIYLGPPNERDFLPHPSAAILVRDFADESNSVDEDTMRRVARHVEALGKNTSALVMFHRERLRNIMQRKSRRFEYDLRMNFSHRNFFGNLCTRYAAERGDVEYV